SGGSAGLVGPRRLVGRSYETCRDATSLSCLEDVVHGLLAGSCEAEENDGLRDARDAPAPDLIRCAGDQLLGANGRLLLRHRQNLTPGGPELKRNLFPRRARASRLRNAQLVTFHLSEACRRF